MAATANQKLADASVAHSVYLDRYTNGVVYRMIALMNRVDKDLVDALASALSRLDPSSFSVERLDQLLSSVRALNARSIELVATQMPEELLKLTEYELGYQYSLMNAVLPAEVVASVAVARVTVQQVYAAAMSRPFQGTLLKEALKNVEEVRARQIRGALRMGYVEGQTIDQMVRRVRGTKSAGYADGLMEASRRYVESIVRTATSHTAATSRDYFMDANEDLVKVVTWQSTLDGHTSPACRIRDGKKYTLNHRPVGHSFPWGAGPGRFHWNCRSSSTAVLKSWRELGLDIDEISPGTRASMDGQVPADQTYGEWLKNQSAARQDDILGETRGKLLRSGGLTVEKFANDRGRWLTLEELRIRDAEAFKRAGL
jgi:hypothetical protein